MDVALIIYGAVGVFWLFVSILSLAMNAAHYSDWGEDSHKRAMRFWARGVFFAFIWPVVIIFAVRYVYWLAFGPEEEE